MLDVFEATKVGKPSNDARTVTQLNDDALHVDLDHSNSIFLFISLLLRF